VNSSGDRIYLFACSKSRDLLEQWISQIKEKAITSGVEFKGPYTQPKEEVGNAYYFRRSIKFPSNKRVQKVISVEHSERIFTKVLVDNSIDMYNYSVINIIPELELPPEEILNPSQDDSSDGKADTETEGTSSTQKRESEIPADKQSNRNNDYPNETPEGDANSPVADSDDSTGAPQYTGSDAVRRRVMDRAGDRCEGCGEPAPFLDKRGEPYLHAHHVYELNQGGPDTPQSVIALCPNCHYRVHQGQDGDEYNAELIEKLSNFQE